MEMFGGNVLVERYQAFMQEPVDLHAVAVEAVAQMVPMALSMRREVALEDRGAASVPGTQATLVAALRNLIENALRVTPEGGTVTVFAGPGAMMGVVDEGPGLSTWQLRRLVNRHVRADHANREGAGLGLAIVNKIVAAHGGRLWTSKPSRTIGMHLAEA